MKKIIAISIFTLISFNASANDNAKRLIELLIKNEISVFRSGGESGISDDITRVNASQLIKEYGENQYKYEQKYDKKLVNIKTVASGINTDLLGYPYVIANGKNQFEFVSLELKNKDDAMNINKGKKLDLICVGTKINIMYPSLKKCVNADSYFQNYLEITMNNINNVKVGDVPNNLFEEVYLALWEFDTKKPKTLDNYKTAKEFFSSKADFNEIMELVKNKKTEKTKNTKVFSMPSL